MKTKVSRLDISEYLENEKIITEYLNEIMLEGDQGLLLSAIGDIAKARGMKKIAEESGLGRESLYKAFAPGSKPRFDTIMRVLKALGVTVQFKEQKAA